MRLQSTFCPGRCCWVQLGRAALFVGVLRLETMSFAFAFSLLASAFNPLYKVSG